jgi:shikimate dehydrogenase
VKAAVIGSPISHSLSPYIFSFISKKENYQINYQSIEVKANEKKTFFDSFKNDKDFLGVNVTLPLKEIFIDQLDFISAEVKILGALNVLHLKDQMVHGYNTDIIGIKKTFESKNFKLKDKTCLLLGAGGSAKAVAYVLGAEGAKQVIIYNRSERSHELVSTFKNLFPATLWNSIQDIDNEVTNNNSFDLIINSTPLGMTGKDSGKDFFKTLMNLKFNVNALAFDLIYTPEHTEFMKVSESMGLVAVGGLGMLIDQALATWNIWVGPLKNEKELHNELKDFLNGILWLRQNNLPIYLTGFMGVGKSTVGKELSTLLKKDFFDTDDLIQKAAGLSIPEIFSQKGENTFREIEHEQIKSISASSAIISLGGGALMNPATLALVKKSSVLIYLSAEEKNLLERINSQQQERPLLANLSKEEQLNKISELLKVRKAVYEQAIIHFKTDQLDTQSICFGIISKIGKWQHKDNS